MPQLAVNVWVRRHGYGPGFGDTVPPPEFWLELDADVWVEGPVERWTEDELDEIEAEVNVQAAAGFRYDGEDPADQPTVVLVEGQAPESFTGDEAPTEAPVDDDLARARAIAEGLGIEIDPRWRLPGLRKAIAKHHASQAQQ